MRKCLLKERFSFLLNIFNKVYPQAVNKEISWV